MKTPGDSDDQDYLPDNLTDCHSLIKDLRSKLSSLEERIAELEKQVSRRNRMIFGKRSAKTSKTVLTGTGKAIYDANDRELDEEKQNLQVVENEASNGGGGRSAPKNAPKSKTVEHTIDDTDTLACPCCGVQAQSNWLPRFATTGYSQICFPSSEACSVQLRLF